MKDFKPLFCLKCNHDWIQRGRDTPAVCPACKNRNWKEGGCVYIKDRGKGLFKIGCSGNLYSRYASVSGRSTIRLRILTRNTCSPFCLEESIHQLCGDVKQFGQNELFRLTPTHFKTLTTIAQSRDPLPFVKSLIALLPED